MVNLQGINDLGGIDLRLDTACIYGKGWGCDVGPLQEIGATLIPIRGRTDFSWVGRVCGLIDSLRPDLLLVHGFNGPVIARIAQKRAKHTFEVACTYHGLYSAPKPSRRLLVPVFNFWQEHLYKRHAKAIVSVCEFSKRYLVAKGLPEEKVTVIHNGIATEAIVGERIELRAELGFDDDDFVIGAASRLDPMKGLNFLIDAISFVHSVSVNVKLVISGYGVEESRLRKQCQRIGISDAVCFAGFQENIPRWMQALDMFVHPSLAESHSIGLLEAMRAGLPIVATDVGGNPESIVDGISGLIVPSKDSAALAEKILSCIQDQTLREGLGAEARKRFEAEFTLETHLRRTADWLLNCRDSSLQMTN